MSSRINTIRLAGVIEESYTDGVGIRYTIFTQGCNHKCKNCQNKATWDFNGGTDYPITKLVDNLLENPLIDGVTLSGGDPMYQCDAVLSLINEIKSRTSLNIWLYTGFSFEECLEDKQKLEVLKHIDVLVDGLYIEELNSLTIRFRGSSNQRVIDVQKSLELNEIQLLFNE